MADHVTLQAQLDAANERIRELESLVLDYLQGSGNIGDMSHEPCTEVRVAAEDAKEAIRSSRAASLDVASINGSLRELKWMNRGLMALLLGLGSWLFIRTDNQAEKITQCCVDARRFEVFESRLTTAVAEMQTAAKRQP
jgi:hypothetical protein